MNQFKSELNKNNILRIIKININDKGEKIMDSQAFQFNFLRFIFYLRKFF